MTIYSNDISVTSGDAITGTGADSTIVIESSSTVLNTGTSILSTGIHFIDESTNYAHFAHVSGTIIARGGIGIWFHDNGGTAFIADGGYVFGGDFGIVGFASATVALDVTNHGVIESNDEAISTSSVGDMIVNYGDIRSYGFIGVDTEAGNDTILNFGAIETSGGNAIQAEGGADTVTNRGTIVGNVDLGADNDVYDGRWGAVTGGTVRGGTGDDVYQVSDDATALQEFAGQGFDTLVSKVSQALGAHFEALTLTGFANATGIGNELANVLTGNHGDNLLRGRAGDDTFVASGGDDFLGGGQGSDTADYSAATSALDIDLDIGTLTSSDFDADTLVLIENFVAGAGNDTVLGSAAANSLVGGQGGDRLSGRAAGDVLDGGAGADLLIGGDGGDTLLGGAGNDRLFGGTASDSLSGGDGADTLTGGDQGDILDGGVGADRLLGGGGADTLTGGSEADVFVFATGDGKDTIVDFNALNDAEDIDLSGLAAIVDFADLSANHMTQVGLDVVIAAGGGDILTLLNVSLGQLDAADFVF